MSGGPVPVWKKYTTGSKGIWEKIRQLLVLVPNRSSGNPYVPLYRVPAPSSNKGIYKDARSFQADDIILNDYFKRDHRRAYPKLSTFNQSKIAGLLQLGNETKPRLLLGDEGVKQLTVVDKEEIQLSQVLSTVGKGVINGELLGKNGEPIVAPSLNKKLNLRILEESEHGMFSDEYPIRIFHASRTN